ncbi:MAG: glycosyltransferase family 39 protein [Bacteroidota bacterium]
MRLPASIHVRELLLLVGVGLISFLPFLGAAPLFDWDEINFAESAREMIVSGNYFQVQIDFAPFWEKPPLFIWLQVICMKLLGINEFAARLPNAIIGVFTLVMLFIEGTRMRDKRFGWLVTGFFFATILPFAYFKSGIIDPTFNFFIFLGIMQIIRHEKSRAAGENRWPRAPHWAGFWIGIATLTKGPVALLVTLLVYLSYKLIWDRRGIAWGAMLRFAAVFLLVIVTWFGGIILLTADGLETVGKFIVYQAELFSQDVAGHARPFYYHPLVFTFGCFPMAAFAYRGMGLRASTAGERLDKRFMLAWFWVVMVLFSIVTTKIVHYSSLLYFPGAFLAARYFAAMLDGKRKATWDIYALYGFGMLVFGLLMGSLPWIIAQLQSGLATTGNHPPTDPNNLGYFWGAINADVTWTGWEALPGYLFFLVLAVNLYYLVQRRYRTWLLVQVVALPIYLNAVNVLVLPRIADHTQNTAVNFFREKADEDVYLMVDGYKTYAHFFYGRRQPFPHPEIPVAERGAWLARGPIDKPVYLVTKTLRGDIEGFSELWFPEFVQIGREGGFDFYLRKVPAAVPSP